MAAFAGLALVARGALHLVTATPFVGFAGAFAALAVAGDAGVGITALAWPDPTLFSLALLIGAWAIVRAIAGGTIAITTRADHRWWLLSFVFADCRGRARRHPHRAVPVEQSTTQPWSSDSWRCSREYARSPKPRFALVDNIGPGPLHSRQRPCHDAADEAQKHPIVDTSVEAQAETHHGDLRKYRSVQEHGRFYADERLHPMK